MRLDNYLVENGYFDSRTKAKQSIERGEIYINDKQITKPSFEVINQDVNIKNISRESFVSLGGFKLKKALLDFQLFVKDLVCVDIGASTGGFTDCLIKNGAKKVYSVDLNDDLLHFSLRVNKKVFPIIKNVKNLSINDFNDQIDLVVADLSFISITLAIPILSSLVENGKKVLVLIKPQFENGEKRKFKNGIVKDKKLQLEACFNTYDCAILNNLTPINFTTAPIRQDKNIEFLMLFEKNGKDCMDKSKICF